jgi:type I site-specific restriction-modification system R (restriction) subunit|tara:strand:- start:5145 stop:5594 length:450 start_codon:yes stop_codon:yes gene_type:complete
LKVAELNLPNYQAKIQKKEGNYFIYDEIRKGYFVLTPEEWVRQNFIHFLINHHSYSKNYFKVEKQFKVNERVKRFDVLIYDKNAAPFLLIECKAPEVKISQATFAQIATYNMELKVPYLIVTNGLTHFICEIDFENKTYNYLQEIPVFK